MHLSPRISQLVEAYHEAESDARRGPRFKEVALALEEEIRTPGVSDAVLVQCFGIPNFWDERDGNGLFVYFFDHEEPGRDRDEWYFHLRNHKVMESGFNQRGTNVLASLRPASDWPQRRA